MERLIDSQFPSHIPNGFGEAPGDAAGTLQTGTWRGEQVQQKDEISRLTDAAEEFGLVAGEKVAEERHAEKSFKAGSRPRVLTAQEVTNYLQKCRSGIDEARLKAVSEELLRQFAASPRDFDPREFVRRQAGGGRSGSDTASLEYAILQYAAGEARSQGSPALGAIESALEELEIDHGPRIRSDLNTVDAAARYSDSPQGVTGFQRTYSELTSGRARAETAREVFQALASFCGRNMEVGLTRMIEAAGQDLSATFGSAPREQIESFMERIKLVTRMNTTLQGCIPILEQLRALVAAQAMRAQGT